MLIKIVKMKNILLTTDFSDNAMNAAKYAIAMFGVKDVNYVVLNSYEDISTSSGAMVSMADTLRKGSIERLTNLDEELKSLYDGIEIQTKSVFGSLTQSIKHIANGTTFDYLVIGTKGMSGLEQFIMGSNTLDVIKSIKIPSLVIPTNFEYKGLHRMSFAADYETLNDSHVIDPMINILKQTGAELKIVNVSGNEDGADAPHAMEGFVLHCMLEGVKHQYFTEVNDNVTDGIQVFIREKNIEMLSLVAHKYTFFDRLFHRSVTKQVSKLAEIPLLIMHE